MDREGGVDARMLLNYYCLMCLEVIRSTGHKVKEKEQLLLFTVASPDPLIIPTQMRLSIEG